MRLTQLQALDSNIFFLWKKIPKNEHFSSSSSFFYVLCEKSEIDRTHVVRWRSMKNNLQYVQFDEYILICSVAK